DSRRDFTIPRSMVEMSSSGTLSMPFGRAAMSVSFRRARIIRRVDVRAASPAFIEALSWSVNWSLRLIGRPPRKTSPSILCRVTTVGGCGRYQVLFAPWFPVVRRVVIGMLPTDDVARRKLVRGHVRQTPGYQVGDPGETAFGAEILARRHGGWVVKAADRDLHVRGVEIAERQRRAAVGAKVAAVGRRALERGRLAARPFQVGLAELRQGGERAANRLLAHAAMADAALGPGVEGVAHRAALATAGGGGRSVVGHGVLLSRIRFPRSRNLGCGRKFL